MGTFLRSIALHGLGHSRNKLHKYSICNACSSSNGICKSFRTPDNNNFHTSTELTHFRFTNLHNKRSYVNTGCKTCCWICNYRVCSSLTRINIALCSQLFYKQGGLCPIKKDPISEVFFVE